MEYRTHRLGHVTLSPNEPVVAGTLGQWTLTYTVGSYGIDEGGTIKVARRFASDWGRPQFHDPTGIGYTTATTTGEASLRLSYSRKAHIRPWMKCLVIDVYDGCLAPGDVVTITFGDRSHGSPGIQAQSFIESAHEIRVLVDATNACLVRRLPTSPVVAVISGEPVTVVPIVPTQAVVGEPVEVFVKGEDRWGNPTPAPAGVTLRFEASESASNVAAVEAGKLHFANPGTGVVVATFGDQEVRSNPITGYTTKPNLKRYWAELHAQSDATVGTGTEVEYFTFGRDYARVDIMSHQGNDFQMDDEDWRRLNAVVREFHEDGRFVVFPGFEWSANTTAGGDRNVIYLEEDLPIMRSSHWQIDTPENELSPAHPADDLFQKLHKHVPREKVILAAHCGGRYADIRKYFDEDLGPLIEVSSCWGVFEWLLWDAFDKNYRVGVICSSDGHKGRPGAEGPGAGQFGIFGGLTCVLSASLTRQDVFTALKKRRCYGTTGPRIDLDFTVDGQPMGSDYRPASNRVEVRASVTGTAAVESIELFDGKTCIHTERPKAFANCQTSRRIRLRWGGARIRGRGRRAEWDGSIEVCGANITRAETFAFDSPLDGITSQTSDKVTFRSRTTGDHDGIDIWLDQASQGTVRFVSPLGTVEVDLQTLGTTPHSVDFGGLDLRATILRYPENPRETQLALTEKLAVERPLRLFVKVTQCDGHLCWSSPIYVDVDTQPGSAD